MNDTAESAIRKAERESTAEVWKLALADYAGHRFASWSAAEQELGGLLSDRAGGLPSGVTSQHLFKVARAAGWLKEESGVIVLRPVDWWEEKVKPARSLRKSALSE